MRPSRSSALTFAGWLVGCGGAVGSTEGPATVAPAARPERIAVALRFEDAGVDASTQTPHTRVVLAVIRELDGRTEAHEVTVVDGACNYVTPTAGALAAASCWWAGSGDNFDVTRSAGAITVRRVEVDEQRDEPLPPATVLRVEVPENAQVQVIVPDTLR